MYNLAVLMDTSLKKRIFLEDQLNHLESMDIQVTEPEAELDERSAKRLLKNADFAITSWGTPSLTYEILAESANLKLILHAAGSVKNAITSLVWERGIRVTSSAEALSKGVGESALGLTITALKNMWQLSNHTRQGGWREGKEKVKELYKVKIGVIGAGRAGRHYIKLLRNFDVEILLYDPTIDKKDIILSDSRQVSLNELLTESDVLSVHAPATPETYKMLNTDEFKLMKDDAIIINTARGTIIDEQALITELKKGRLFACIDVTDPEPPDPNHPFRTLPNVVLTPHIAGAVNNGLGRIGEYVISELKSFLTGEEMRGEVLASKLDTLA